MYHVSAFSIFKIYRETALYLIETEGQYVSYIKGFYNYKDVVLKNSLFQAIENWITHPGRQWHWDLFNKAEIYTRIASHPIFPTVIGGN